MPPPWRPKDYADKEFADANQRFRAPDRGALERAYRDKPDARWKADDPGNLPGAALCWIIAIKVRRAMVGVSRDKLAKELGLSPFVLKGALAGREPFPIEYVAALAERFGMTEVLPTPDEFKDAIKRIGDSRPERRGTAYDRGARGHLGFLTTFDLDEPVDGPPAGRAPFEKEAEEHLASSAGLLVGWYFSAMPEEVEVVANVRIADRPVSQGDGIHVEVELVETGFVVAADGALDPDWPEAVLAPGVAELGGHFVTRVLDAGDDPRFPRLVEALFLVPEHNAPDPMPVGRPYRATVEWHEDEELREVIPVLMPVLDGYAETLLGEVSAAGDPFGIEGKFPTQPGA